MFTAFNQKKTTQFAADAEPFFLFGEDRKPNQKESSERYVYPLEVL